MRMRRLPRRPSPSAVDGRRLRRLLARGRRSCSSAGRAAPTQPVAGAAGWESLLGDRPSAQLGGRWIVVLAKPSLATRVAAAGGVATEEQERAWTAAARRAQRDVLARLAFRGAPIEPEHAYYRVFNGFATPLDARALAIVVRDPDVRGVFPVRAAIPAAVDPGASTTSLDAAGGRRQDVGIPGFSGAGVTVALLDTGVDLVHPYIRACAPARPRRARPRRRRERAPEPDRSRAAGAPRHRDGGPRRRVGRPGGPRGRRPRGGAAADPRRGLAAGHVRRRLGLRPDRPAARRHRARGRPERGRRCARRRPRRARRRRRAVRRLHRRPARRGRGRGAWRSTRSSSPPPATTGRPGRPTAASAGRAARPPPSRPARSTRRRRSPTGHVLLLAGLRVARLGRPAARRCRRSVALGVRARRRAAARRARPSSAPPAASPASSTATGYSRVGGAAVLLPRGTSSPEAVREVVAAGARAVLVDGPLPAGSLGTDGPVEVPILGLSASRRRCRPGRAPARDPGDARRRRRGVRRRTRAVGAAAPFSSEGLAFDGGPKPEVSAAGIGLATSDPGRDEDGAARYGTLSGSSAAAALTAGAAALLAQARPDLDAAGLKQALVASARRGGRSGGRRRSTRRRPPRSSSSPTRRRSASALRSPRTRPSRRIVTLRNVSRRSLDVTIEPGTADAADIVVETSARGSRGCSPGASAAGLGRRRRSRCCRGRRPRSAARCASRSAAARRSGFRGRSRCRPRSGT